MCKRVLYIIHTNVSEGVGLLVDNILSTWHQPYHLQTHHKREKREKGSIWNQISPRALLEPEAFSSYDEVLVLVAHTNQQTNNK